MALSTLVAPLLSQSGLQPVSRLEKILAGQGFDLAVMDGGAAVLTANATGERESLKHVIVYRPQKTPARFAFVFHFRVLQSKQLGVGGGPKTSRRLPQAFPAQAPSGTSSALVRLSRPVGPQRQAGM